MAKHDENKDLRLISHIAKVNYSDKSIHVFRSSTVGIRTLGRIDYLVNHCDWTLCYDNNVANYTKFNNNNDDDSKSAKQELKKSKKEHSLTNKTRKSTKRKVND